MTAATEDVVGTEAPTRWTITWPVHHLDPKALTDLVKVYINDSDATEGEKALIGATGDDIDAIRTRRLGLTTMTRRLLARRRSLLDSGQWDKVAAQLKSRRFARVFADLTDDPDMYFFIVLAKAVPMAERLQRTVILEGLANRRKLFVAHARWGDAVEKVRSPKHRAILTRGLSNDRRDDDYIDSVTAALVAGERALRNLGSRPAISGTSAVAVPQGEAKRRRAHQKARADGKKHGPQRPPKSAATEKSTTTTRTDRRDRTRN